MELNRIKRFSVILSTVNKITYYTQICLIIAPKPPAAASILEAWTKQPPTHTTHTHTSSTNTQVIYLQGLDGVLVFMYVIFLLERTYHY